jgi:hypothetical protein
MALKPPLSSVMRDSAHVSLGRLSRIAHDGARGAFASKAMKLSKKTVVFCARDDRPSHPHPLDSLYRFFLLRTLETVRSRMPKGGSVTSKALISDRILRNCILASLAFRCPGTNPWSAFGLYHCHGLHLRHLLRPCARSESEQKRSSNNKRPRPKRRPLPEEAAFPTMGVFLLTRAGVGLVLSQHA